MDVCSILKKIPENSLTTDFHGHAAIANIVDEPNFYGEDKSDACMNAISCAT